MWKVVNHLLSLPTGDLNIDPSSMEGFKQEVGFELKIEY
jgi:hypothetical protein